MGKKNEAELVQQKNVAEMKKFVDDKAYRIENDIERLQMRTGMYVGRKGEAGALHLCYEAINNDIDECLNEESPADTIDITIVTQTNTAIVSDNGRGIPFENVLIFCTEMQAGTKIERDGAMGASAGENGVGLTAINALSSKFQIISRRYGESKCITFEDGKLTEDKVIKTRMKDGKHDHGTTVIFTPSEKVFKTGDELPKIPYEKLIEWLERISLILPEKITINLWVDKGGEKGIRKKFNTKEGTGLTRYIKELIGNPATELITFKDRIEFEETIDKTGKTFKRFLELDFAMAYMKSQPLFPIDTYCNVVHTVEGGSHEEGAKRSIGRTLSAITREALTSREKDWTVKHDDALNGLQVVLSIMTSADPGYTAQVKEKVINKRIEEIVYQMVSNNLKDILTKDQKLSKKFTDIIRANVRARINSEKTRIVGTKGPKVDQVDLFRNKNYIPVDSDVVKKLGYSEVLVVEGHSAGSQIKSHRYAFQGAIFLRGVPINAWNTTSERVLSNAEIKLINTALGCGIGDKCDPKASQYKRFIIMTDADTDGGHIFTQTLGYLAKYMRPILEAGMVFRVLPPLYRVKDKKKPFLLDKQDYFQTYRAKVIESVDIFSDHGQLSDDEIGHLIDSSIDYPEEVDRLKKYYNVDFYLLEHVVYYSNIYKVGSKEWKDKLYEFLPEMHYDAKTKNYEGVFKGNYQILHLDKTFFDRVKDMNEIFKNPFITSLHYAVRDKNKNDDSTITGMSLRSLLVALSKYSPEIVQRLKGLGELSGDLFRDSVLDPQNRLLVQVTVAEADKALETLKLYLGKDAEGRKELAYKMKVRRDELDN